MPHTVVVGAPSRLHFGLFALGGDQGRRFGGIGAMVDQPGSVIRLQPSPSFEVTGPMAERLVRSAQAWSRFHGRPLPDCRISVERAPPEHVGLGVGTQLGLSVAAGLSAFSGIPCGSPAELALSAGRGLRSAVGTYGFALGGLIVEQGKLPFEPVSPLDTRVDLPEGWRFLLVRPLMASGLCGEREDAAIQSIHVPGETTAALIREAREHLLPAAVTGEFDDFAASLFRYCRLAGSFYADLQGGPYNGPILTGLVEQIRGCGHAGIGQSSWGPTLFVAQRDESSAQSLAASLRQDWPESQLELIVARPNRSGARVQVIPADATAGRTMAVHPT